MIKRVLAGAFGAVVFGILAPILYLLLAGMPGSLMDFVWIAVLGAVTGAVLGALFPVLFGFVFETFMGV